MAEALISEDHFYINGSQFNNTDVAQSAVIVVEDSDDILNRTEDWLVHVTRFACDSMVSMPYIEADATARWEIKVFGTDHSGLETFNFTLENDYATPQDLVSAMNVKSRFRAAATILHESYETYRFVIDAGGRFRLTQPAHEAGTYITYAASASMNKLLGFDRVTSFLRFTPSYVHQFCNAVDWLHEQAQNIATPMNIFSGHYYKSMNNVLVHLLNGLAIKTRTIGGVEITVENQPQESFTYLDAVNVLHGFVGNDRGATPNGFGSEGQALVPKGGAVLCEYFDMTANLYSTTDPGFKAYTSKMNWINGQTYSHSSGGIVEFKDLESPAIAVAPSNWPTTVPGTNEAMAHSRYIYPFDSICGYTYSGFQTVVQAVAGEGEECIGINSFLGWHADNPTLIGLILALPAPVKVGDDMWFLDKHPYIRGATQLENNLSSRGYSVHQVLTISDDRMFITIDYPIGPIVQASTSDPWWPHRVDLLFTDRRVPFQSRSVPFTDNVQSWQETYTDEAPHQDESTISHILLSKYTGAEVGDTLYWVLDDMIQPRGFIILSVYGSIPGYTITCTGRLPDAVIGTTASRYGVFIHKRAADLARWAIDVENIKKAATTFSYDGINYPRGSLAPGATVGRVAYPARYQQAFDRTHLHTQVLNAAKQARSDTLFDNVGSGDGQGTTFEGVSEAVLESIPETSEIVNMGNAAALDFGNWPIVPFGTPSPPSAKIVVYTRGTVLQSRLPNPFYTIRGYIGQTGIMEFVRQNSMDRPWLHCVPGYGANRLTFRGAEPGTTTYHPISPLCIGVVAELLDQADAFLIWAPPQIANIVPIDIANALTLYNQNAYITVAYNSLSRPFKLGRKELTASSIVANTEVRLYSVDDDYIASTLISQVEHIFPFRQIILTSADLQQVPERTQDASARQPILTSYTLSTIIPTSIDSKGEPAGGTSEPFGTIYFSESGARRFHHLTKVPGALRRFKIEVGITRKDPSKPQTRMQLAPGGHFTCQLLFMRKREE